MGTRAIFQLETPWSEDELFDLGYEQTRDVMEFTHLNHPVQKLTRYDHDRWTLETAVFASTSYPPTNASFTVTGHDPNTGTGYVATDYSYVVTTIDAETGQESLPTVAKVGTTDLTLKGNYVELSWDAVTGAERYNVYRQGGGAYGYIGTTDDPTFIDDNIAPDYSLSYPIHRDPISATDDYPAVVAFWQQRAVFARTYNKPNGIFASQSGNLFNFDISRPLTASDAATFAVSGRRVNAITHLVPLKNLIVFTTDTVFSISGGSSGDVFSPLSIDIKPEGYRAASRVRPVVVDDIIFFETLKGCSLRTLGYQFQADGYKGNDLTVFAPHLFKRITAVDMSWAEFPFATLNLLGSDGDIRALTWQAEQDVWGWTLLHTDGVIESCCTVSETGEDVTYYVVRRTIGEEQMRFIEYSATGRWVDVEHAVYLDSALTYEGEPATQFYIPHLEGKTVTVLADGAVHLNNHVVTHGWLNPPLVTPARVVTVGLSYESWIRSLPLKPDTPEGSSKGVPQTLAGVAIQVLESRGLEVATGKNLPPGQTMPATSNAEIMGEAYEAKTRDGEPMGTPTELFSGELWMDLEASDWRDASVVVRQRYPLPMHVTGLTPVPVLGD